MQVLQSLRWNAAVASRAERELVLLSSSCFSACFAIRVLVLSGLTCALFLSCLTWGEHLCAVAFRSLFLLAFLQLPNFDFKSKNIDDLWNLQSTVRFLAHLGSTSNMSWILVFCAIQSKRKNLAMGSMVLRVWKIVRAYWECGANSYKWSDWLELLISFINIGVSLSFLGWVVVSQVF